MTIPEFVEILKSRAKSTFEVQQHSEKRVYIKVARENLTELVGIIFKELGAKFSIASGVHIREGFEVLYHFTFDKFKFICTLRTLAPHDDPKIDSLVPLIAGARWIEREIYDILGVQFSGHPNLKRLVKAEFLAENEYPFRKDFDIKKFKEKHGLATKISYFEPETNSPKKPNDE